MTLRISGLASGMDIDSIVKQMMTVKRIPLDKLNQQKQALQWQRDNYREINSKLVDFRNNKLLKYNTSAQMNTQKAVVSGNTTALTAEATSSANGIPMSVTVTTLAQKSTMQPSAGLKVGTETAKLSNTLGEIMGATPPSPPYELYINNTTISFNPSDKISTILTKINNSNAKVTAVFDEISGKFSITANEYGAVNNIKLTDKDGNSPVSDLLPIFKLNSPVDAISGEVTIKNTNSPDFQTYTLDNNSLTVNGIKLTFLSTTKISGIETPALITSETNSDKAMETIKSFVEDYNNLLSTLNSKITEEKYRDFAPLTDEQKKEMSDKDIEQWELKAKSGLLKNDEILKSTISSMRSVITNHLGDLSSIGITTGEYFENGKLYINDEKLKAALQNNPQKVSTIFQGTTNTDGLFNRLSVGMNTALDKLASKAGTSKYSTDINSIYKPESIIGKKLIDYTTRIGTLQNRLQDMETNYYKQFTAMEKAISKYNSQSTSLSSYFS
ncbi:MAG: flagellar filament capping protein FliD [Paenibacillus sp.]|nr:flagellar filament capping protein FliD [Paenibacillus sp.]